MTFPIFLTGYDVQGINLYDVFARSVIAPNFAGGGGTSFNTPVPNNPTPGSQPFANNMNPNFLPNVPVVCAQLPGVFPSSMLTDLQQIFTTGVPVTGTLGCPPSSEPPLVRLGAVHSNAIGYAT